MRTDQTRQPRQSEIAAEAAKILGRATRGQIRDLRKVHLDVREALSSPERNWVVGQLVARCGVNGALWLDAQPRVSIEYDANVVTGAELFDILESLGLHARPVLLGALPLPSPGARIDGSRA